MEEKISILNVGTTQIGDSCLLVEFETKLTVVVNVAHESLQYDETLVKLLCDCDSDVESGLLWIVSSFPKVSAKTVMEHTSSFT